MTKKEVNQEQKEKRNGHRLQPAEKKKLLQKDARFQLVGEKILSGEVKRFSDIYDFLPPTVLAHTLKKNVSVFVDLQQKDPYFFRVGELLKIAKLCGVEGAAVLALMEVDIKAAEKNRKDTSKPKPGITPEGHTVEYLKKAKEAQNLFATGSYTKTDLARKLEVSRPTLDGYLKADTRNY
ncbi:hypothetical protein V9K67_24540 [Paraflavisolibacter sp. H34]|uniref:hypothetical protein n=1 Tax=Huijunlia imazamoxiresistens TaxID=3127457 RepID=UPI003018C54D